MNLLFFQVRLFTVRVRLKLRASVALSPVFSEGKTQKDIAEKLGFKTHSAVTKHLQAMRAQFEEYMINYR